MAISGQESRVEPGSDAEDHVSFPNRDSIGPSSTISQHDNITSNNSIDLIDVSPSLIYLTMAQKSLRDWVYLVMIIPQLIGMIGMFLSQSPILKIN
jgi:hypothetical protein